MKQYVWLTIVAGMFLSSSYNYTQEELPEKENAGVFRRAVLFTKKRPFLVATGAIGLGLAGYFGYQHLTAASGYGLQPNVPPNAPSDQSNYYAEQVRAEAAVEETKLKTLTEKK